MNRNQYIGITETSDPCFHLDLFDNLYRANIIVTKNLSNKLIEKLVENKEKCILHCTCTGMGGTRIEPFVPTLDKTVEHIKVLIEQGFPLRQIVLRIDPIIPTQKGIETATRVLEAFKGIGIERLRMSFLDMYKHVKGRFMDNNIKFPYDTFHADINVRKEAFQALSDKAIECGFTVIQTCGEPGFDSTPCISQMDVDILGLTNEIILEGSKEQRIHCSCPQNKKELITKHKPQQCAHKCLYCFWK